MMQSHESPKPIQFMGKEWHYLGHGTYHTAYVYRDNDIEIEGKKGPWVIKRSIGEQTLLNKPQRIFRLTKEMYPTLPLQLETQEDLTVCISPYVPGVPNDIEIAKELLRIYRDTRRIVLDGCNSNNFKCFDNGDVVCVDPEMAVRRNSVSSRQYYRKLKCENISEIAKEIDFQEFFNQKMIKYGKNYLPLKMITFLFYLEEELAKKEINNDYLRYDIVMSLDYIVAQKIPITEDLLDGIRILIDNKLNAEKNIEALADYPILIKIVQRMNQTSSDLLEDLLVGIQFLIFYDLDSEENIKAIAENPILVKTLQCLNRYCAHFLPTSQKIFGNKDLQKAIVAAYDYLHDNRNDSSKEHGKKNTRQYLDHLLTNEYKSAESIKKEVQCWIKGYGFFSLGSKKGPGSRHHFAMQYGLIEDRLKTSHCSL
jgi:hypothetical protein